VPSLYASQRLVLKTFADRLCIYHDQKLIATVDTALEKHLDYLKLPYLKENCRPFAAEANAKHWSHIDYLVRLIEGEVAARHALEN
jgi:hypothetical protein